MTQFPAAYIQHLKRGPFPGQMDPWAEAGRYFQQLHGALISSLTEQIQDPLLALGYIVGREASLQIAEQGKPDLFIHRQAAGPAQGAPLDYAHAAEAALVEPGVLVEGLEPEWEALFIRTFPAGELVTVVEILSPRNKAETWLMQDYMERRARLRHEGVHVVEIDLTRSVKRLIADALVELYAYHIAVHLHDQPSRFIGVRFGETLKSWALPLRSEVMVVELQAAYDHAYRQTTLAGHILRENGYAEAALPFPSLLAAAQRQALLQAVQTWRTGLQHLHPAQ